MVMSDGHSIICWRAIHIAVKLDSSGAYPTVPELWKELPVKGFKPDSAMHGTKNIIANRLMAVSERSLIGRAAGYRGSIPFYDCWERTCKRRFESFRSDVVG